MPSRDPLHPAMAPAALYALLDNSWDLCALLNTQGCLLWANRQLCEFVGRPLNQLQGQSLDLVCVQTAPRLAQAMKALATTQTKPIELDVEWVAADGQARQLRARFQALADESTAPLAQTHAWCLNMIDITEARSAQSTLKIVQDFGRLGVWERDLHRAGIDWDDHMLDFFGLERENATLELAFARVHPDDRTRVISAYQSSLNQSGRYGQHFRVHSEYAATRSLHGQWEVHTDALGKPRRVVGVMVDDTEVYRLAHSVTQANEQLKLAVDLGHIVVWRHDLAANLVHFNHWAWEVLGLAERTTGVPVSELNALIHPDDLPHVLESAELALKTGRPSDMQARYKRSDGAWRYLLARRMVQRDSAGTAIGFVGVALDISEQVEGVTRAVELARQLELTASIAGIGLWARDAQGHDYTWNSQMYAIYGVKPRARPPGFREWLQLVHRDDREPLRAHLQVLLDQPGILHEIEFRIVDAQGQTRWLVDRARFEPSHHVANASGQVSGITLDITERRRTELSLRSAMERIALATRTVNLGTWQIDMETHEPSWDAQMFILRGL